MIGHCCKDLRFLFFFFLMIRRPPRSTLFPTRRSSDLAASEPATAGVNLWVEKTGDPEKRERVAPGVRSEEHTSELQSRLHVVCRLLLEKKKEKRDEGAEILRKLHDVASVTCMQLDLAD